MGEKASVRHGDSLVAIATGFALFPAIIFGKVSAFQKRKLRPSEAKV